MDINYLKQYSEEASKDLSGKYFSKNPFIDGKSILTFCEFDQINLFVLKNLFSQWEQEVSKLRSPYFDFEHTEVQTSLKGFMEKLSFHIKINENDFTLLLSSAIEEALLLAFDYELYFQQQILEVGEFVSKEHIQTIAKYTKLGLKTPGILLESVVDKNKESFLVDEMKPILKQALDEETLDRELIYEKVNDLYPLDIVQLIGDGAFDSKDTDEKIETSDSVSEDEAKSIHELHHKEKLPSLNDKLSNQKSLASLANAFNLHQKFTFVKKLFDGNDNLFLEAMERIDKIQKKKGNKN